MRNRDFYYLVKNAGSSLGSFIGVILYPFICFWGVIKRVLHFIYSNAIKYSLARPIPKIVWILPHVLLVNPKGIQLGENVRISRYSTLSTWQKSATPLLYIGSNCRIGEFAHITAINKVLIGNNVLIGKFVTITDNSHGKSELQDSIQPPISRKLFSKGETIINDNVWIGDKVTVLPGVTIGKGAIIGANSVVASDVPEFCVACGNPARIVKQMN